MENENLTAASPTPEQAGESVTEPTESFGELLSEFEKSHKREVATKQLEGTVISLTDDLVFLDVGMKIEGALPRGAFRDNAEGVALGDKFPVSIKGRSEEGYYDLSLLRVAQPTDWDSLEQAFAQKTPIVGTVTAVVKGGLSVDVGVRAFMPASRSGVREAAEMEKLVGAEITCRIIKLDVADEDVVVDRRSVLEEEVLAAQQTRQAALKEGDVVNGEVRGLASYGAFIDIGGIDGLLHVSDISYGRVGKPEEVLTVGQRVEVKILKLDPETHRISLGMKQLQPEPWDLAAGKYTVGQRITGTVTRLMDFGAFVELEPGIEGLIHVSEMSWVKKVRKASDVLKVGETVEAVVLAVNQAEKRISLGLKQALGDPWEDASRKFPVGSTMEGPVTRLTKFGAFVELAEGVEGLVHISEITAERRLNHPQEALRVGQIVKAMVLGIDPEKRQIKLSMKQLVPTDIDEFLREHHEGDVVSGRILEQSSELATVELGEGIRAVCRAAKETASQPEEKRSEGAVDLSSLTSMLQARWKSGASSAVATREPLRAGQVRSFRIAKIDRELEKIELELS